MKIENHLNSTSTSDIRAFLNTYENLLRQHIIKENNRQDRGKFTEELTKRFWMHVLRRIIPTYAKCAFLEDILGRKEYTTLDQIRELVAITVVGHEESKAMKTVDGIISKITKYTGSVLFSESNKSIIDEAKITFEKDKIEHYKQILPLAITKVVNQLSRSRQKISKVKSLNGVVVVLSCTPLSPPCRGEGGTGSKNFPVLPLPPPK